MRRKAILLALVLCALLAAVYFGLTFNRFDAQTRVVAIGYHSDSCDECNQLKAKMKRMNLQFGWSDIVFIKYDQTTPETAAKAEATLKKIGFYEVALRDKGLKYVRLYERNSRQQIAQLNWDDAPEVLSGKIQAALSR